MRNKKEDRAYIAIGCIIYIAVGVFLAWVDYYLMYKVITSFAAVFGITVMTSSIFKAWVFWTLARIWYAMWKAEIERSAKK